jgi:hypothetical protein
MEKQATPAGIAATQNGAKNGQQGPQNSPKPEQKPTSEALEIRETPQPKDVARTLERLEEANQLAGIRAEFKRKLEKVEKFRREVDGTPLKAIISNLGGDEIELLRNDAITRFIDGEIEAGRQYLANLETKLVEYVVQ